ncbi:RHS repeat-associated core domain-containing protein [Pseudomonas sp. RIT623]|uniref:RHS repeat-associated core domain-containing protein n=1 Tax=Pseudomonas sp. RIT623 TaxID=2559075 RepID=UPI00106F116F|nr:RHS repeat-associated core domain-containing protein [Pseudomonas sp. RIT623]TFF41762.1 RHS repeat protein [Pseudomonas sp. RIT623]
MGHGAQDRDTPSVTARGNRGEAIREIRYCRHPETPGLDTRITRQQFDALGHPVHSIDPRLATRQQTDPSVKANLILHPAFTGAVIASQSVDAGHVLTLNDSAGRPLLRLGATGVTRRWHYEAAPQAGRLLQVAEQLPAAPPQITERLVWAANDPAAKARNLAGQLSRHYDTAGRQLIDSLGLTGATLSATRQLLEDGDSADWQGADEAAWAGLLAPDVFTSSCTVDATGVPLTQVDAQGHAQRQRYDIAGQMAGTLLTPKGMSEQPILTSLSYSAAGQKLREAHANGVVTHFTYEPRTQRLLRLKTEHSTKATVLQDLHYAFDPVGNVLRVSNAAEARRFARNRVIEAVSTYTYDTLYQLITATGREMAGSARHNPQRPADLPVAADDGSYANYTRRYTYDRGGNLLSTVHTSDVAEHDFTLNMTVSSHSNRAVPDTLTADPVLVDGFFDAAGNQLQLQPGQTLAWTAREQLLRVTPVSRDAVGLDDQESYRYGGDGLRIVKASSQEAKAATHHRRVLYLPGLEIRTLHQDDVPKEALQVVTIGQAGRAQVRMLHWDSGLPDGIANDGLRYSYDNLIGSGCLELDDKGLVISQEEYYPYGGTAVWSARSEVEADYKTVRYSGKERDATGLYYYGYRYYQPMGRWLSADPAGTIDGLNLYAMVKNNPTTLSDSAGLQATKEQYTREYYALKESSFMINETRDQVLDFLNDKSSSIAFGTAYTIFVELLAAAYGSLAAIPAGIAGGVAGPPGAVIASTVVSTLVKDKVKGKLTAYPPAPKANMAERMEHNLFTTKERATHKAKHYFEPEYLLKKAGDKGANWLMNTGLTAAGAATSSYSVPFAGIIDTVRAAINAKKITKEAVVDAALEDIEKIEAMIEALNVSLEEAFAQSIALQKNELGTWTKARGNLSNKRVEWGLKRDGMNLSKGDIWLKYSNHVKHYAITKKHLGDFKFALHEFTYFRNRQAAA